MALRALLALPILLATGCMTFNGKELRRPEVTAPATRPIVAVAVGDFTKSHNGGPHDLAPVGQEGTGRMEVKQVARIWKASKLIDDFGFPGELHDDPTHVLTLNGNWNEDSSILAAVFTGLTLYLFPSSAVTTRDFEFDLERTADARHFAAAAKNSKTVWQQIVFLPVFFLMPVGAYNADKDLSLYVFDQLARQGAFEAPAAPGSRPDDPSPPDAPADP